MASTERIVYTHGDTAPALELGLMRANRPVALDPADTVEARVIRDVAGPTLTKAADVVELGDALTPAVVRVTWALGDLVNGTPDELDYLVELVITTAAGVETTPSPTRITVRPAYA